LLVKNCNVNMFYSLFYSNNFFFLVNCSVKIGMRPKCTPSFARAQCSIGTDIS
jgi:hypothetical protein